MKKINKIKYGLITLLIVITTNLYGQNGFLGANHSYQIEGNELTLFTESSFSIGFATTCPSIDTIVVSTINNNILIDVFFDLRGVWPQAGCSTFGTYSLNIDKNFNAVIVNVKTKGYGNSVNDSIINNVQTDTLLENSTSLVEEPIHKNNINIYPNPAKDILQIDVSNDAEIKSIELFNIDGKKVKTYNAAERNLNISSLGIGAYFLKLSTTDGVVTKKVVIE